MKNKSGIAIVGMDCRYPGAHDLKQYWENILSLRQQFRRIPDKRLNLDYYGSENRSLVDYTYSKKAAVLSDYQFDRVKYRVSKSTFEQTDMAHWLALDVATGALKDAGFENGEGLDRKRVGVVLGNSLNGEFTRANVLRLRWPYVFKVLESTLSSMDYKEDEISKILAGTEKVYKEPFPEPDADTLAGGLSNTIAGRICNYFDFNGGGFTIDGACSSSLLAFTSGCNSIANGELDVVLVGGVDVSIDPFEVIGFARNGALAAEEMEVYSSKSQGFWPGEGCGIAVMMNEEEARKRGLNIYAVIRGWGISSDGKGGITRPKPETQQLAFERAYQRAGYNMDSIAMFEGHGTGTPLGDEVELTALVNSLKKNGKKGVPATLGSVKHLIGHTKAAAGIAGVIKACLSLKHGIIPSSRSTHIPHSILQENENLIRLGKTPGLWEGEHPMRASVSSMGFGGINVHLTMEESAQRRRPKKISSKVRKLISSFRDCEVFPFSATGKEPLLKIVRTLREKVRDISRAEFIDLSASLSASFQGNGNWKASLVASNPDQLLESLERLEATIESGESLLIDAKAGVFFRTETSAAKIGFLFPGQGAPIYNDFGAYEQLSKDLLNTTASVIKDGERVVDTSIVQPAIVERTLQSVALLEYLGVEANWGAGHSLGEITALSWAGVMDEEQAVEVATERGKAMAELGDSDGAMLALNCNEETLKELKNGKEVWITGYNGKGNYVVGGHSEAINIVQQKAFENGVQNVQLKVSHAFHTPMMKKAAQQFRDTLLEWDFDKPQQNIVSTVTGERLNGSTNIADHLYQQIEKPVQFTQAIEQLKKETDLLIEVGPGTALSKSLGRDEETKVLSLDFGSHSIKGLCQVLSAAFVMGSDVQFEELSTNRFYREFDLNEWELDVLVNPCEKTVHESSMIRDLIEATPQQESVQEKNSAQAAAAKDHSIEGIQTYVKNLISEKTEIPISVIKKEDKILSQLHLNSLAITEIISLVTKSFNKSHMVFSAASILANADGSIEEVSKLIFEGETGTGAKVQKDQINFDLTESWTHIFKRTAVVKKRTKIKADRGNGKIIVRGLPMIALEWESELASKALTVGNGAIYIYKSEQDQEVVNDFVSFLNQEEVRKADFVALVNLESGDLNVDLRPVLRTFQQEAPQISTFCLNLESCLKDPLAILVDELKVNTRYKEIHYTTENVRSESECEVFFPTTGELSKVIEKDDVILATGGGKGITFESIYNLAQLTGAKLAILGRSQPGKSAELNRNFELLKKANIEYRYYATDVCDAKSVRQAVQFAAADLGPVRAVVHGAGVNRPKLLSLLTPEDFHNTHTVKVDGLKNVLNSLNAKELKLLIGYGSIIAQSGMQGNADYAWANDQLALYIDEFGKQHQHCRSITMEWSVWDEVGMGVSLSSVKSLKEKGVWPIPVKQGIRILNELVADPACEGRFIICGRYGGIPTLNFKRERLPLGRFISKVKHHVPAVEIVSEVNINLKDDVYLQNHVFQNQYVFPTVMILEGAAQVCSTLTARTDFWKFENLKISKSIFVPKNGSNLVRFIVSRLSENRFKVVVQSEDSNFEVNCFELEINLATKPVFRQKAEKISRLQKLDFNVEEKFYDDLLFHHGPFRRVQSFYKIQARESIAAAHTSLEDQWFGPFITDNLLLGDAGLNDAAIHCHQACRPGGSLLPVAAGEIAINPNPVKGPLFIKTLETKEEGNDTTVDVYVVNDKGDIKQYWKDLVLTKVSGTSFNGQWDPHLLVPHIEYKLIQLSKGQNVELPLESCLKLIKSFENNEKSECKELKGYSISLKKQEPAEADETEAGRAPYQEWIDETQITLELEIANLNKAALLQIAQV